MVLLQHSKLLPAVVVHNGCGYCREALVGLKYLKEVSEGEQHSEAKTWCQYSVTFSFTSFLNLYLVIGFSSRISGCGRLYWRQRSLTWWNQEKEDGGSVESEYLACWLRGSLGKWQIMENSENCLM